jgi:double-stranded RNA-binding protein Staufen
VPGLLYIDDKGGKQQYKQTNGIGTLGKLATGSPSGTTQAATIAKELLNGGTSPTADALAKKNPGVVVAPSNLPALPTSGQGVSPKEQLAYLSQVLGFSVTYTDFPKKGEYLSLVSLSTNPPQVSHGAGPTLEASHNNAAHTALRALANTGLDNVTQENGSIKPSIMK